MLQDQAEPRPYADVELAIQRELGLPIAALFAEFEPEARAAASLAQARGVPSLGHSRSVLKCCRPSAQGQYQRLSSVLYFLTFDKQ